VWCPCFLLTRQHLVFALLSAAALAVLVGGCGGGSGDRAHRSRATPPPGKFEVASACPPAPAQRASGDGRRLVVTTAPRQRIDGWGVSVVTDTSVDPLADPKTPTVQLAAWDRLLFRDAGINLIRVFGQGYRKGSPTGARAADVRDGRFALMRRASRDGVRFMYTGAAPPGDIADGNRLRAGSEARYAAYIAGYLRVARDVVGVPFSFAAIGNEPDNRSSLLTMPPEQAAAVYRSLNQRMRVAGLRTRLVLGDTTGWGTACPYARRLLATPGLAPAAAAFATHPYYGTVRQARSLSQLAAASGLPVWQTEFGTGCSDCRDHDSTSEAMVWARKIASALTDGNVSAWFGFRPVADVTHGPGDGLIVRTGDRVRPYYVSRRYDVFRQFSSVAPPGSRRVDVRGTGRRVPAVAFRSGRRLALVVINQRPRPWSTTLRFPGPGRLTLVRSSALEHFRRIAVPPMSRNTLDVVLPPRSVSTYLSEPE